MSLRINHNIDSIIGQRNLQANSMAMSKSLQRLSSGLRINSAADNPSGLVISEQMRAQITGLNTAINNTQNGISMVQTTEGALDEVNSLLNKARQLTLDAANSGVNDVNQLAADQAELDNVISSITRISQVTQFGTKNILNGSLNGASSLSAGLSHVKVGNLANNAAINDGQVSIAVTGGAKETVSLAGTTANSIMFSGAVTGLKMGSKKVLSGVQVSMSVAGNTVNYTTTGVMTATQLAAKLSSGAAAYGYNVTTNASGRMVVNRVAYGSDDFAASITFSKAAVAATAGTDESITAKLQIAAGGASTPDQAASLIFGASDLSGVTTASVVKCGAVFGYSLKSATGLSVTLTGVAKTSGATKTVSQILSGLQTSIRTQNGFSGAVLTLGPTVASGIQVKLSRGNDAVSTDFNFSLTIDYKNNALTKSQANMISLTGQAYQTGSNSTFMTAGGVSGVTAANLTGTTELASGAAMELIISGRTITLTGNRSMTALATAFTSAIQALTGGSFANVYVQFTTGGAATYSGLTNDVRLTGTIGKKGFVVYNTDGRALNVSLKIDQKQGLDISLAGPSTKTGVIAGATLNLATVSQTRVSNVATIAGVAAQSVSSTTGASTVTNGGQPSAVLTTSNGVSLNLKTAFTTATGGIQLTLSSGAVALGYQNFSAEVSKTLATSGGSATFTLNNGAEFQIGANGAQKVGVTIETVAADSLGRNVTTALSSLQDLLSSKKGALTNGLSDEALQVIDAAINEVTNLRGTLGAFQSNTLQSGLNSLQISTQNLTAAESTIRDVDFAAESATFTRNQILVQASTSMLAQANQMPQSVLKLLG